MARIKFAVTVDEIRGSIGGATFQENKYGWTVKAKPSMRKPVSPKQQDSQAVIAACAGHWKTLTSVQRAAWDTHAAAYPMYTKSDPTVALSGYNYFLKYQSSYYASFGSFYTLFSGAPVSCPNLSMGLARSGANMLFTFSADASYWNLDTFISLSKPMQASQTYIGTKTRVILKATNTFTSQNYSAWYTAVFGELPSVGDSIMVRFRTFWTAGAFVYDDQESIIVVT